MEQNFSVLLYINDKSNPTCLKRSLDSVLSNTVCPAEIVIAFTGSINEEIKSVIAPFQQKANIRLLSHPVPYTRGTTLELFLPKCSYELVALQEVEAISLPDRFEKQLSYFTQNPETAVLGSAFQEIDAQTSALIAIHTVPQTNAQIKRFLRTQCPFQHETVMFKKSAILAAGNYKTFPMLLDDYYLWVRVIDQGYQVANLPDILVAMPRNQDSIWIPSALHFFLAEKDLCNTMRQFKLMGAFTYYRLLVTRFIKYFLVPNWLRSIFHRNKWIFY